MNQTILLDIADAASALTDPKKHREHYLVDDGHGRNRPADKPHETTVPGLIQQLRDAAEPGVDGQSGGEGGRESVPVAIDALSLLASIGHGAELRAKRWGVDLDKRRTPEDHIRGLVGLVGRRPSGEQADLRRELLSWQWQAEIITGWRTPPKELIAPCPQCDARGTLLAHPDPAAPTARCVGCGQRWSDEPSEGEGHIGVLARHVIAYQELSHEERREHRAAAVDRRLRSEGKPARKPQAEAA